MSIIAPNPPATLFETGPWLAHKSKLQRLLERERDEIKRSILVSEIESADSMILIIENDPEHQIESEHVAQVQLSR